MLYSTRRSMVKKKMQDSRENISELATVQLYITGAERRVRARGEAGPRSLVLSQIA